MARLAFGYPNGYGDPAAEVDETGLLAPPRAVRPSDVKNAPRNPARVIAQKEAMRYEGRDAVVGVSTRNAGSIATVWRKRAWWKGAE